MEAEFLARKQGHRDAEYCRKVAANVAKHCTVSAVSSAAAPRPPAARPHANPRRNPRSSNPARHASTAPRVCVAVLNKCTSANVCKLMADALRRMRVTSDDEVRQVADILVRKAEFHPQYAETYVRAAGVLAGSDPRFRAAVVDLLCHRTDDFLQLFAETQVDACTLVAIVRFANRMTAYAAFEDGGYAAGFRERAARDALRQLEGDAVGRIETCLKVLKATLPCLRNGKELGREFLRLVTPERIEKMPPKSRFLVMDITSRMT